MILIVCPTPSLQKRMEFRQILLGGVNRALGAEMLPSGKGVNAARAVMACGGSPEILQFLGGETGRAMGRMLREERIPSKNIEVRASTRVCVTLRETKTKTVTELVEDSKAVRTEELQALKSAFLKSLSQAGVVMGMGSLPPGVPTTFYRDLIRIAQKFEKPFIIDAQGEALMQCLPARPWLVKPNRNELAATIGEGCIGLIGLKRALRKLHRLGAQWILVTDGRNPVWLSHEKRIWKIPICSIRTRNPIGAGDSLAGGLALALDRGYGMLDAVRFGIACGMASAAGEGYGLLDRDRLNRMLKFKPSKISLL